MLGFASTEMALAFICCILAPLFCVIYGLIMWNKGEEPTGEEFKERVEWEREERALEEGLP